MLNVQGIRSDQTEAYVKYTVVTVVAQMRIAVSVISQIKVALALVFVWLARSTVILSIEP